MFVVFVERKDTELLECPLEGFLGIIMTLCMRVVWIILDVMVVPLSIIFFLEELLHFQQLRLVQHLGT